MITRTKVETVIGKTFADKLDQPIFSTGNWAITRRTMVERYGCANFIAAARLARQFKRMGITTPRILWRTDPIQLARTKGIGEAAIFVAMSILEANGFDPLKWWTPDTKFGATKKAKN